jgi:fermentation-respiration switch protein FrsA (DUF1100 family)
MKLTRNWRMTLLQLLIAVILALMWFRWFEHRQVYHPTRTLDVTAAELRPSVEEVELRTRDGLKLNAWFFQAPTNSPRARFVVLLCHGNGGNISHRVDMSETLRSIGLNVLSFDYRGYGLSEGRPSEEGTYLDAQAAYAWARAKGFQPSGILAYGESLGGGVASELCRRETVGGLILQSTFTSIADIGAEFYPWLPVKWLNRIRYDTLNRLPEIRVPVLLMHSRSDGLVGFKHCERNLQAANEPKFFCELQGDHNDPLQDEAGFVHGIEQFLNTLEAAAPRQ